MPTPAGFRGTLRPVPGDGVWPGWPSCESLGLGGDPGRRHGPGQDDPAAGPAAAGDAAGDGGADAARLPDVAGRQLAAGGGHVRPDAAGARAPRRGAGPRQGVRRRRSPAPTWSSPPTRWPPATPPRWPRSTGTGSWWTRRRRSRTRPPGRRSRCAALPARHRIAVTGTPVENRLADLWSIMEFANPGLLGTATSVQGALRRAGRAPGRRGGGRAAAPADRAVRAAPGEDRQVDHLRPAREDRDGGGLQPHRRAGLALPGRGRRHDGSGSSRARASSGAAWCSPR